MTSKKQKPRYTECSSKSCYRFTEFDTCNSCQEDKLRRETRETVYQNDVDLSDIHENRRNM